MILHPITERSLVGRGSLLSTGPRRAREEVGFAYQKRYAGLYSTKHDRFVLREEHVAELKRIVREHNSERAAGTPALSMSDIVNAVLDFAFEHPAAFYSATGPDRMRESFSNEVYRRAYLAFMRDGAA